MIEKENMTNKLKILVVDDEPVSIRIYQKVLGEIYDVLCANNGKAAIEILTKETDISMTILDIYMPGMSGFEVLKEMKASPAWRRIPVLMCTASESGDNVVQALELGATDCLSKPINPKIMQKRVANVIQREYLERIQLETTLKNANEQLHLLLDNVPGGIVELDLEKDIKAIYYNDTVCSMAGLTREELETYYNGDIFRLVYDSDRQALRKSIAQSIENHQDIDVIFRIYNPKLMPVWVHMVAAKEKDHPDKALYHAVVFDISKEKEAEMEAANEAQRFRYLAEHDSLTGINNRKAFYDKTEMMLKTFTDKKYVLICWDIEKFKVINDIFGVDTGDRILKTLAMHLATVMLGVGTYGRLGNDHFVICYPEDVYTPEALYEQAKRALGNLGLGYDIGLCVGIYRIEDVTRPVNYMCDRADLALQETKDNYMKHIAYYDSELIERLVREQELCRDMEDAFTKEEFKVFIQPKYDLQTNRIVGGESLIRWFHSKKGLLSPLEFIPLFEENGAVIRLDSYVWEKTCEYLTSWRREGIRIVPISVNISRKNFIHMDVAHHMEELIRYYELEHEYLELEVTESVYTDDYHIFYGELERLQRLGFKILMDDFGSGYSSFNMLKEAPVDGLKLDLRFLSGSDVKKRADKILTAIMYMARLINMSVVAEGVETPEHVQILKEIHCDVVQGYFYSKPVPVEVFREMLLEQERRESQMSLEYEEIMYQQYVRKQRRYNDKRGVILIAEDTEVSQEVLRTLLNDQCDIISASNGKEAFALIEENAKQLDLVILDIYMPELDGLKILKKMKLRKDLEEIPVIIMSSNDKIDTQIEAFKQGAVDYLTKPFIPETVQARVLIALNASLKMRRIQRERMNYQHQATLDPMTGIYNKVTLEEMVNHMIMEEPDHLHAIMVFDVDNFKSVNDEQGHLEGDHLIREMSELLMSQFRKEDLLGRIGGDEFVAVMHDIPSKDIARSKAQGIVELFEQHISNNSAVKVTLSIGLAFAPEQGKDYVTVFSKADRALYRAKANGKCRYIEYKN